MARVLKRVRNFQCKLTDREATNLRSYQREDEADSELIRRLLAPYLEHHHEAYEPRAVRP